MNRCNGILVPLSRGLSSKVLKCSPLGSRAYYLSPRTTWHHPMVMLNEAMREIDREFRTFDAIIRHDEFPKLTDNTAVTLANRSDVEVVKAGDKDVYTLNVHLGQNFPAENIKLSLNDRVVTIEAKVDHKSLDGHSRYYQEVTRQFTLPENADLTSVKSTLTNGILKIEAPLPPPALENKATPKQIPIIKEELIGAANLGE